MINYSYTCALDDSGNLDRGSPVVGSDELLPRFQVRESKIGGGGGAGTTDDDDASTLT